MQKILHSMVLCNTNITTGLRIRNVLPGSGSGIIIPDPDPTNMKTNFKKVDFHGYHPGEEEGR